MKDFNCKEFIELENDRARLEPLTLKHADLLKWIIEKDTGLVKYTSIPLSTGADLPNYIELALQGRDEMARYPFAVYDKKVNGYAGSTSYAFISNKDARLEIGYTWIGYDFQRTGLNTAMKLLMLQYAFETLGFSRVELRADSRNLQSRRAMEKIGCTFEGELRSHMVLHDGSRRNTVYYSILADEWPKIKKERFPVQDVNN